MVVLSQGAFAADDVQTETLNAVNITADVLKIDTSTQDSPETVNVISNKELQDKAVRKIDDALRYTPGYVNAYGADYDTDWLTQIRGFEATKLVDGQRQFKEGFFDTTIEPYGVESVELLQGPSSSLYGDSMPGGVVNVVTKKPTKTPHKNITVMGGNRNFIQGGFDISDKVNEAGTQRYRLVAMMNREDGEMRGTHGYRAYIAPSFTIDVTPDTSITFLASYLKDDKIPNNGFFSTLGTLVPYNGKKLDRRNNLGDTTRDTFNKDQFNIGWNLTSKLNNLLTYNQKFNYGYQDFHLRSTAGYALYPYDDPNTPYDDTGKVHRWSLLNDGTVQSVTFDNNVTAAWVASNFDNIIQVGLDYQWYQNKWLGDGGTTDLGVVDPFNSSHLTPGPLDSELKTWNNGIKKHQIGVYTQAQTIWNELILAKGGIRYDKFRIDDSVSGANAPELVDPSLSDHNISWNAGLMYLSPWGISPYVSYSESFFANASMKWASGTGYTGAYTIYKPVKTKQLETGLKITPNWLNGYLNLAWFKITQDNALTQKILGSQPITGQSDKQDSQGIEVQLNAELIKGLNLDLTYAYLDAKTFDKQGDSTRSPFLPRQTATAWLSYNFANFGTPQLTLAAGARYQGDSIDNNVLDTVNSTKKYRVPSAVVFDAAAQYQFDKHWKAQLNVMNLTDKYYVSASSGGIAYLGQGRIIRGTLSYDF